MKIEKNNKDVEIPKNNKTLNISYKSIESDISFDTNEKYLPNNNLLKSQNKSIKKIRINNIKTKIKFFFILIGFIIFILFMTDIVIKILLKKYINDYEIFFVIAYLLVYIFILYYFFKKDIKFRINDIFGKSNKRKKYIFSNEESDIIDNYNNLNKLKLFSKLTKDSYNHWCLDNSFVVFNSIYNIIYIVYSNQNKSIISFNLIKQQNDCEIKNAHLKYINIFNHYFDKKNKKDIIMSVSCEDNNIKLWDPQIWTCILNLNNVNKKGEIFSACFLINEEQNYNYIVSSNFIFFYNSEPIKIFDFNGKKIKEINDSNKDIYFIETFYDKKLGQNYIITGNNDSIYSYDFDKNEFYHKYYDNINEIHRSLIIKNYEDIVKLIESCDDGHIRIWDFHSGILLDKIKVHDTWLYGICLWKNDFLFVGCKDNTIKLLDLKNKKIIKNLPGHNSFVSTIKKIKHPLYGDCLISQGWFKDQIKLWINLN